MDLVRIAYKCTKFSQNKKGKLKKVNWCTVSVPSTAEMHFGKLYRKCSIPK